MSMFSRSRAIPCTALFFTLSGLVWCGYVAFPTTSSAPCVTSGCALLQDVRFFGLSLWWVGGAYFFLLALICLRGNRRLARSLAAAALLADSFLLLLMFLTGPCFDCLVVAFFFGMVYWTLRDEGNTGMFTGARRRSSLLLPLWLGLFLGNVVLAAEERLPRQVLGNAGAADTIRVYFSPSCKACREALLLLGDSAALYPVEEKQGDMDAIIRLARLLEDQVPMEKALAESIDPDRPVPSLSFYERTLLRVQLLRNKTMVLRQGFRALPLIQINGMPGGKAAPVGVGEIPSAQSSPPGGLSGETRRANGQTDVRRKVGESGRIEAPSGPDVPDFLRGVDSLNQCGGANTAPCD